jgi:hypothetical protein
VISLPATIATTFPVETGLGASAFLQETEAMVNRQHTKRLRAQPDEHFGWTAKKSGFGSRTHGNPVVIVGFRFKHRRWLATWGFNRTCGSGWKKGPGDGEKLPNYFTRRRGP